MVTQMSHNNNHNYLNSNLAEGTEMGDLKRLVHPDLHIDEYKSKMGSDEDICVLSVKIGGKEPAQDLVNFIEKGYDWVLDADISSGEIEDGDFLVFIEAERDLTLPENIFKMMEDIMNLTEQTIEEWSVKYPKTSTRRPLTLQSLKKLVPTSAEEYISRVGIDDEEGEGEAEIALEGLKSAAGLNIDKKAPVNDYTDYLRVIAGIK